MTTQYAVTVSNVGWVLQNEEDYNKAKKLYDEYVAMGAYELVTLWEDDEPIEENYLEVGL